MRAARSRSISPNLLERVSLPLCSRMAAQPGLLGASAWGRTKAGREERAAINRDSGGGAPGGSPTTAGDPQPALLCKKANLKRSAALWPAGRWLARARFQSHSLHTLRAEGVEDRRAPGAEKNCMLTCSGGGRRGGRAVGRRARPAFDGVVTISLGRRRKPPPPRWDARRAPQSGVVIKLPTTGRKPSG